MASNSAYPKPLVQTPILKPVQVDSVPANQLINTQLSFGKPSPLPVSSHAGTQSWSGSTSPEEQIICKASVPPTPSTPISKLESPNLVNTMGSDAATGMMPSGIHPCALKVPQARKASLARFLEKRKGRIMSTASPYNLSKKSLDYATTMESNA
ncbi:hypothetical protein Goari_018293 [Gossypium aridum]|uniref:Uncharacterized protein n=1 Tax=Gossypium aridum TaxID=34290 RepID=A0A7J8WP55_GOSAI|nr:hypothetical protein [Gossypium aridum]